MNFRRLPPFLIGLGASLLIFAIAGISGIWVYHGSQRDHMRSFQADILHSAAAAASVIDVNLHATFTSPAQETTATYLAALAVLDRVKTSNRAMKFIYTCILRNDSIYFVLDPTPAGDADGDGVDDKSHIMQPYPDAGAACRRALATGQPAADDKPYTDAWGTFLSAYAPFFDAHGKLAGVVGVDEELTRYLSEDKGMREAGWSALTIALILSLMVGGGVWYGARLLSAAEAQRQSALEQAEKAARVKAEFLAVMSHEIRTPLGGVIGMLDALLRTGLEGRRLEMAGKARSSAEGMLALLNDILDFSKIEAGGMAMEAAPFDVAEVCRDAVEVFRSKAEAKGLALSCRGEPGMDVRVIGDAARLRQVLLNLIGNAVKFTPEGGVNLSVRKVSRTSEPPAGGGADLEFLVADTGIGIPAEKLGLLFHAFSQADVSTTRVYGGSGLGLAICKRLVELMGGNISVTSVPGEGSCFRFSLPLPTPSGAAATATATTSPSAAPASAQGLPAQGTPPGMSDCAGLRILLAEDDAVNREVALLLLAELGCRVDAAVTGREAVDLAGSHAYAAVLMDCRMPELDGFQATAAIRRLDELHAAVPIIAMTANSLDGDRNACLAAGMDDYLTKPVRLEALRSMLRKWCPQSDARPAVDETRGLQATDGKSVPAVDASVLHQLGQIAGEDAAVFLAKLANLFLAGLPATLAGMDAAVGARDGGKLRNLAHDLCGGSGNLGAGRLAAGCRSLEAAAGEGRWQQAVALLPLIREESARVAEELAVFSGPK